MTPATPYTLIDRLLLGLAVVVVAAIVTYLELGHPLQQASGQSLTSAVKRQATASQQTASPTPSSKATVVSSTAQPATAKTAITTSYVHLRSGKSVNSAIIANLNGGTTVQLRDDADATWQGVRFQGKDGYIYRDYLQY